MKETPGIPKDVRSRSTFMEGKLRCVAPVVLLVFVVCHFAKPPSAISEGKV